MPEEKTNLGHRQCRERAPLLVESHDLGWEGEVRRLAEELRELLARRLAYCRQLERRDGSDWDPNRFD